MTASERIAPPGTVKNSVLGVLALATAALDFTIGTRIMSIAGIFALIVALYSFTKAARALRLPSQNAL